jgi:hypothetical protein
MQMASETKPPNEEQIADLLKNFRPQPGTRYLRKMEAQPWNPGRRAIPWGGLSPVRPATLIGLILIIILGVSLFSPSVQAIAQRFAQFFIPTERQQLTIEIPLADVEDPETLFSLSIAEAEALAGFAAKTPERLPMGYTFAGAGYNTGRKAIVLNYATPTTGLVLRISQRQVGTEYQEISASATVEIVDIGGIAGEYVSGAWSTTSPDGESTGPTVTLQASWDAEAEIQLLRWLENDILYEIIFAGGNPQTPGYLTQNDLIALAKNMY